ncbi:MAG: hypothetical protein U9N85_03945 [Bacteroidota bacterium]|nr:hypothetical protein [Bacteroidota bacterium]
MHIFIKILKNRNFILLMALFLGLTFHDIADAMKPALIPVLAVIMIFSISGISFKSFTNLKQVASISATAIFLNFILYGIIILVLSHIIFDDPLLRAGFVVIAATPPGVAVIPFSVSFKGNLKFALTGILGTYTAAIFLSPLIISLFTGKDSLDITKLLFTILWIVVVPLILSRFLRHKKVYPSVEKIRGKVIDIGFAIIIYVSVGLNKEVLFNNPEIFMYSALIFFITMFVAGILFSFFTANVLSNASAVSYNLMYAIKSSGFAAATSIALFEDKAAIPAAVLSIFMLLYLLIADLWLPAKSRLHKYIFWKKVSESE